MTIYLDVIWFLNFCIDFLLLSLTAIVLKRRIAKWRVVIGALLASSIVLILFSPISSLFYHPLIKVLFSMLIVLITFGYRRFHYFVQNLLMFYFVSFICGGGLFALHFFVQNDVTLLNGMITTKSTGFGSPISWALVIIGFPLLWYFSKGNVQQIEAKKVHYDQIVSVEIRIGETRVELKGLIDSGNQLSDPISKAPVMILDLTKVKDQFPEWLVEASNQLEIIGTGFSGTDQSERWEERLRVIPYRGVGQQNQFLLAIKPDLVKIYYDQQVIEISKVLIGLNDTILSAEGEYDCILHPKMVTNGSIQEPA